MRYGLLFVLLMIFAATAFATPTDQPKQLSYEEFLEKLEDGQVKSVTLEPFLLEGTYSKGDAEVKFFCCYPIGSISDPLLAKLLEEEQVAITKPERRDFDSAQILWIARGLLLLVIPSALLVLVIIYLVKMNKKIDQVVGR